MTRYVLGLLFMVTLASCSDTELKTPEDFRPLIEQYNAALIKAYQANDAGMMKNVTSPADLQNIEKLIAGLREHKVRMLATQKSLKMVSVETPNRNRAVIFTEEQWDYTYNDIKDGSVKQKKDKTVYQMAYLVKLNGNRGTVVKAMYRQDYEDMKKNAILK